MFAKLKNTKNRFSVNLQNLLNTIFCSKRFACSCSCCLLLMFISHTAMGKNDAIYFTLKDSIQCVDGKQSLSSYGVHQLGLFCRLQGE